MDTSILEAVRADIAATEARLGRLREMERLAVELAGDMIVQAAATARTNGAPKQPASNGNGHNPHRRRTPRRRRAALTPEAVVDAIRDSLADGPRTLAELHRELGISATSSTRAVFEEALARLNAVEVGRRTAGALYGLERDPEPEPEPEPAPEDATAAYLRRRVTTLLGREPLTVERLADRVDAPLGRVEATCRELVAAGAAVHLDDGRFQIR
jgi:predicted Rossmann fold nucleotide-binding protein DprA/Smf involved in DNA uptake